MLLTSCEVINGILGSDEPDDGGITEDTEIDLSHITFDDVVSDYNGMVKRISISGKLPSGVKVKYEGNDQKNAGEYTVTAKFYRGDEYLEGKDLTATLTIKPSVYDMTHVSFNRKSFTYTGDTYYPSIEGTLPDGVSVEYVYDGEIKNAGTYVVVAKFTGDPNYRDIPDMQAIYTVAQAKYDMSGVSFEDAMFVVSGEEFSIFITGTLPEGVSVSYVGNGVSEIGEHKVNAVFVSADPNYRAPSIMTATITVTPEPVVPVELVYERLANGTYEVVGYVGDNPHLVIPSIYNGEIVTSIKSSAFEGNTNITYAMIPASIKNIGNKAFKDCSSMTSVTLAENGITVLGYKAFANCPLTELDLPDSLQSIGQGALAGTALESLRIPFIGGSRDSSNAYLGYVFGASSYTGNSATVPGSLKRIVIGDTATSIPAFAFFGASSIEEIKLGKKVAFIGNNAFYGTSVSHMYLPASVVEIPADASAQNSPFYGLADDFFVVLEKTATEKFGSYWNYIGSDKIAMTLYMKTYSYYLENIETIKNADPSSAELITVLLGNTELSGFSTDVLEYSADADINEGYPFVSAAPTSAVAKVTVEQASSYNGGVATVTVVSADLSASNTFKIIFNIIGEFKNASAEIVGKDGTTGTVTFVVDDGDHATAEYTKKMMDKYDELKFTYAILTNRLATLKTSYDSSVGKYNYVMSEDGKYTYTVNQTEVDFWNNMLRKYSTEVISHTNSHAFWGNDDNGGVQKYVDASGNVQTSSNLPIGSASAEIYASKQIIEDLLGIRALTHTVPGIGVKTTDTTVNGILYPTYYTYYASLLNEAMANGDIVNLIGNTMGTSMSNLNRYVTKDNIKDTSGVARLFVTPNDNKALWTQFIDNAAANNGWATYCIHKITPSASSGHYILETDAEALFSHAVSKNVWIANYTEAALYYREWASAEVDIAYTDGVITLSVTDGEDNTVCDEELTVRVNVPATWGVAYFDGEMISVQKDVDGSYVYVNILPDSGEHILSDR